ncbi:MAG: hypothetical protein EPO39_13480 [Candidatus Manganitrophaceae bacterium]|nr:MAG: hypothetical protein EPO39_13480 [Candidatus Manganitrophaceae bacterium]
MPLNKSPLSGSLKDLFEGKDPAQPGQTVFPPNPTEAGKKWAEAYKKYAEGAQAGATQPLAPSLTAAQATLAGALASGFSAAKAAPPPAAIAGLAAAMDLAFVAFWMTPPVAFAPPPPAPPTMAGVVSLAPPGVLTASLISLFTSGTADKKTAAQQADSIATLLDSWTKTVMVINTPVTPPGPPLPPAPLS